MTHPTLALMLAAARLRHDHSLLAEKQRLRAARGGR
jgi:hypothetical protein